MQPAQRIELQENDLAAATMQTVERLRRHQWSIAAVVGLLFAGLGLWVAIAGQRTASSAESWRASLAASREGNAVALQNVVRQFPGTPAANLAELTAADMAFAEGVELLFTDGPRGKKRLEEVSQQYQQLVNGRPNRIVAERAVFGLAKTNESLGRLDEARKGYEAVAREYADGACAGLAAARAASLARPAAVEWYKWFAGQDFASLDKPAQEPVTPPTNAPSEPSGTPAAKPAAESGTGAAPAGAAAQPEPVAK
ncbi:MAG: tetratricopeptide repeat protein [Planctomycetia bacterium]|jgi:hypothetical protein